jgi:hypothetical protein
MAGNCSASPASVRARRSRSTRGFSRPARDQTAWTGRTKLQSRISPRPARCAKTTSGTGPNQGRFGTLGRNTFRGPAFYNFDFALIKDTPFGRRKSGAERVDLQFRSEFFNLFNIVNMGLPANILTGSGFGEISKTAGNSRQIQFSLKLIY